jgi:hypothetical protein
MEREEGQRKKENKSKNIVKIGVKFHNLNLKFLDTNECLTNPCHVAATCKNTIGGFLCACKDGYSGNGLLCTGAQL